MRALLLVSLLVPFTALAGGSKDIHRDQFGDAWPFTIEAGKVRCTQVSSVIFVTPERKGYALNGSAKADGIYRDVREIWRDNPNAGKYGAQKMDLSPIITLGLSLCD